MQYEKYGIVNTRDMLHDAMTQHYAVGAFNFYNMETFAAILGAARKTHSPIILAVSESALKYISDDMLMAIVTAAHITPDENVALHLDHGHSVDACRHAIDLGFSSVMLDASTMPIDENIALSATVAKYAHARGVTVEAELGILHGREDENTASDTEFYTNPSDVADFVSVSGVDSLAVAIGTSHGAYKMKQGTKGLRFDILDEIANAVPNFPLVLHGASSIPPHLVRTINEFGGDIKNAHGIPVDQLKRAAKTNICKINVDSDSRLAFTAAIRQSLANAPENFNPREYLANAMAATYDNIVDEITNIMGSANRN